MPTNDLIGLASTLSATEEQEYLTYIFSAEAVSHSPMFLITSNMEIRLLPTGNRTLYERYFDANLHYLLISRDRSYVLSDYLSPQKNDASSLGALNRKTRIHASTSSVKARLLFSKQYGLLGLRSAYLVGDQPNRYSALLVRWIIRYPHHHLPIQCPFPTNEPYCNIRDRLERSPPPTVCYQLHQRTFCYAVRPPHHL